MSAKCPKCQTPLEDADFGIKICANADCGAMLFVDFDGSVQLSTEVAPEEPEGASPELAARAAPRTQPGAVEGVPMMHVRSHDDSASESAPDVVAENVAAHDFDAELAPAGGTEALAEDFAASEEPHPIPPPPEWGAASEAEGARNSMNEADWFDQPLEHGFTAPEPPNIGANEILDFSDVVEFANSAELEHNPLAYTLWIEGIDSGEIRARVEDVLSDSRLNFHVSDVMKNLKRGVLELRDLNPVKASFIASRLRAEAVNFRWRQSIFGGDAESEGGAA